MLFIVNLIPYKFGGIPCYRRRSLSAHSFFFFDLDLITIISTVMATTISIVVRRSRKLSTSTSSF